MAKPRAVEQKPALPTMRSGGEIPPVLIGRQFGRGPLGMQLNPIGVFDVIASGMGGMYDQRAAAATQIYANQLNALAVQNQALSKNKLLGDLIDQGFTPSQALNFASSPQNAADYMLRQLLGMG